MKMFLPLKPDQAKTLFQSKAILAYAGKGTRRLRCYQALLSDSEMISAIQNSAANIILACDPADANPIFIRLQA